MVKGTETVAKVAGSTDRDFQFQTITPDTSITAITAAYLAAMENPLIHIIGHPDDGRYEVDYEALVQGAKEYGKILELNNHSMDPGCSRIHAVENDTIMLNYCKKYQVPVVMDSDAHFDTLIGEFDMARELLTKLDFPEELVLNRSAEEMKKYLKK